jgi:hypothetical protein
MGFPIGPALAMSYCVASLLFHFLGVLGVQVQGSRFSATCVNLEDKTNVNDRDRYV